MNTEKKAEAPKFPLPSETMRAMRPHLFSDAQPERTLRLSGALLEYHLDTLTSRKQEYEFEHFCRKLAEKEICPNLRTQTGPTGGGDSKVDTETYPVAHEIAERWWIGEPAAGSERWAFAFSAKEKWREKCTSDVAKIAATSRDYKRIYFFTNQFVSDRNRASTEDTLTKEHGVPVHVMDRAWIVEKVLENGHAALAATALGIEGVSADTLRPGPRDTARLVELEDLDKQIADPARYTTSRFQLVEDCLEAALLARGLERPRAEVEGRFDRAARLAQDVSPHQQMRVAYNQAWTAYWWHNDYAAFSKFYDKVESLLADAFSAADTQRLLTLWQLLLPSVTASRLSNKEAKIAARRAKLEAVLAPMVNEGVRPNNALQARSQRTMIEVTAAFHASDNARLEKCWGELITIVDESKRFPAYPIEQLSDLIQVIGNTVDSPAFDSLYEKVVDVIRKRRSEGEAGAAYRQRGGQKLEQEKPYEAIHWFGRAEEFLLKEEYADELVLVLAGSSLAYERVGLLWAARQKILAAAERSTHDFMEDGRIGLAMARSFNRLVWLELQLGRILHALLAMDLAHATATNQKLTDKQREAYSKEVALQEIALMLHLLRLSKQQLQSAAQLPDVLERLGLTNARLALLFALGHTEAIKEEYFRDNGSVEELASSFSLLLEQPMASDIASIPLLATDGNSLLKSRILGAEINVNVTNNPISFSIAESLLGGIEALLATSKFGEVIPRQEVIGLEIRAAAKHTGIPAMDLIKNGLNKIEIVHSPRLDFKKGSEFSAYRKWLTDAIVEVAIRAFMIGDFDAWKKEVLKQERALTRALDLADALSLSRNIFGNDPKLLLRNWVTSEDKLYPLMRDQQWQGAKDSIAKQNRTPPVISSGPPPAGMFDSSKLKHTDHQLLSPIDGDQWGRARWRGVAFGTRHPEENDHPPFMGFIFGNEAAAKRIFGGWRRRWGSRDEENALRIAIIRGVSARKPADYSVSIGPNLERVQEFDAKTFLLVSRINRMEPTTTENLDRFLAEYRRTGMYFLMPVVGSPPKFVAEMYFAKRELFVRDAWQVGENDPDLMILRDDDDPLIPPYVAQAPVTKALERVRASRAKRKRR